MSKFAALPIRLRLSLIFTALVLALMLALGFSLFFIVSGTLNGRLENQLKSDRASLLGVNAHYPNSDLVLPGPLTNPDTGNPLTGPDGRPQVQPSLKVNAEQLSNTFVVYNPDGTLLADPPDGPTNNPILANTALAARSLPADQGTYTRVSLPKPDNTPGTDQYLCYAFPVYGLTDPDNPQSPTALLALVVDTTPDGETETLLATMGQVLLIILPVGVVLAFLIGIFGAGRALRPIKAISETARQIEVNNLNRRIDLKSKDELGQLARTFDNMMERLQTSFGRQRRFVADASHDLKTPLAVIEAEATLMLRRPREIADYQRSLELIGDEAGRMKTLIDDLLTLARADSGEVELRTRLVALDDLAAEAVSRIARLANQKKQRLDLQADEEFWLMADPEVLDRLFFNLLSNAVKYTQEGGSIRVSVGRANYKEVFFEVADNGPGIAPEHLPFLFDRFYRVDRARTRNGSSGLGLAIAQWAAQAHGGRIEVRSAPGQGAAFTVWLPLPLPAT